MVCRLQKLRSTLISFHRTRRPSKLGWEQQLHISSSGRSLADRKSNVPPTNDPEAGVAEKLRASLAVLKPHENIYNLPNILTVSRLVAAPVTAYLLLHDHHQWALALFAYAGITDLVDGWLARRWKLQTVAGSVIDPMADKALMIILTVTLAIKGAIPCKLAILHTKLISLTGSSIPGHSDSGKRCIAGCSCYILPLRLLTDSEDFHALLGFLFTFGGSPSHDSLQIQHVPSIDLDRINISSTSCHARRRIRRPSPEHPLR